MMLLDQLAQLPHIPLSLGVTTGSGGKKAASYLGVSLLAYCKSLGAIRIQQIVVSGEDGYAAAVLGEEAGDVYLAWLSFGSSITLVFPADGHRQRWVKNVTNISWQSKGDET